MTTMESSLGAALALAVLMLAISALSLALLSFLLRRRAEASP